MRIAIPLLACLMAWPLASQNPTATLVGTVTDSSGAVVPAAEIEIQNVETRTGRTVRANAAGDYTAVSLLPGEYQITAKAAGFKNVRAIATLQVGETRRVDLSMEVGAVTETVTVTAAAAASLNTEQASIGQVVDSRRIVELPLNGRNFYQLATLAPGAISVPAGASTRSNFVSVFLGGTRARKTAFYLDGVDTTETQFGGTYISPSVDAIQEFRVQSSNMSAEYGRSGGNLNVSMRSGGNDFHGSAFEFVRDDALAARNFFAKAQQVLRRSQMGGAIGGPIVRNKTFFFANWEGTRQTQGLTNNFQAPSEDMKRGVFPFVIKDPFVDPRAADARSRPAFPGNRIPADRISPQAQYFLRWVPTANSADSSGRPTLLLSPDQRVWQNQYNLRVDQNFSSRDILFARYSLMDQRQTDPTNSPLLGNYPPLRIRAQNAGLGYTRILGAGMLNELRLGYNRSRFFFRPIDEGTNHTVLAGVRGGFEESSLAYPSFPDILITGYADMQGLAQDQRPKRNRIQHYQVTDGLSLTRGAHSFKAGFDFRRQMADFLVGNRAQGEFFFNGNWTGDPFADYLLGTLSRVRRGSPLDLFGVYDNFYGVYAQDDWKVSRRLTLSLGLRWEINPFYRGLHNQMSAFDFKAGKIILASEDGKVAMDAQRITRKIYPLFADLVVTSESQGLPISVRPSDHKDWAPRIGLAWRPLANDQFVVRAGYGIYYEFADTNFPNSYAKVPPLVYNEDQSISTSGAPVRLWSDPFAGAGYGTVAGTPTLLTSEVNMRNSYSQQWNLAVQRALPAGLTAEVAYVGQKGNRLELNQNFNDAPPSTSSAGIQQRRPYPRFGGSSRGVFDAQAVYHALQTKLERRFAGGLSLLAAYTWSKSIDNASNGLGGSPNQNDLKSNRGPSDTDLRQRFVSSFLYELPFGRGRKFGAGMSRAVDALLGGWQAGGILTLQSGFPYTVGVSADRANVGRSGQRPDLRAGINPVLANPTPELWFDTRAFALPALGTFGNLGRNTLYGDGLQTLDFLVAKTFRITERVGFEFRGEAFNLFNHANFNAPTSTVNTEVPIDAKPGEARMTPNRLGTVTSAREPRILQFGVRFTF